MNSHRTIPQNTKPTEVQMVDNNSNEIFEKKEYYKCVCKTPAYKMVSGINYMKN